MLDHGDLAEWAEIYSYRYGTSKRVLERALSKGQDVILDIDGQGARQIRRLGLPGIFIFILPPSLGELRRRLSHRKTEAKKDMQQRIKKAKDEMAEARWYDYLIINNNLKKAKEQLKAIILAEHCKRKRMAEILEIIISEK